MQAYLDNSATTPLCKKAKERMVDSIENTWGNPSSLHEKGIEADLLLKNARKTVCALLSCTEKEIFFTSGGTEGNNLAIFGAAHANKRNGNRVITSAVEHPSVQKAFDRLGEEGFEVIRIPTDKKGFINLAELENAVNDKTVLISIMAVNNEVGTIQPVEEIAKIVKRKSSPALIHVDAVQAFGKIPLTPKKWGIDLMTVSSHKIHGPKGAGALFVKEGTKLKPVAAGGGQERDIRPGTEPMPAIAGFYGAMEELKIKETLAAVTELRDYLTSELSERSFVTINSPENALPFIVNFSIKGLRSETVLNFLSDMEVYVSSGSACSKGHKSPVLSAMGLDDDLIDSSLRISMSRFTTKQQLDLLLEGIDTADKIIRRK